MKIIISPAKNMSLEADTLEPEGLPVFLDKAQTLVDYLKTLSFEDLKALLSCNETIARLNYGRYQSMNLRENTNPALVTFEGIQYKYMAPRVFTYGYFDYAREHLRILSGLYGILKPFDGIVPENLAGESPAPPVILDLASEEYAKAVRKYLKPGDTFITCVFAEQTEGALKEKGVYVKMARGEMVRFMAENNIIRPEELKPFTGLGYRFSEEDSSPNRYVFKR